MTRVAYLPGDGIGREVLPAARRVLEAAGFAPTWVELPVGWDEWRARGAALPPETLEAMTTCQAAFFGAITSKGPAEAERELESRLQGRGLQYTSPILRIRRAFDLGINLRPVRSFAGNPNLRLGSVDLIVFRENTEDVYADVEARPVPQELLDAWTRAGTPPERLPPPGPDTALTARVTTRGRTRRLLEAAFAHAARRPRRKVTLLEKANVMRATGGLVQEAFREVAARHPQTQAEELQMDAACALMVREPSRFDVVATTNLFGDIFSDLAAEVGGGLGLAPSANLGPSFALFEPVHGSALDIAGRGVADPVAAVLSGAMLARHLGADEAARRAEAAVEAWFGHKGPFPPDLGGTATTAQVEQALVRLVGEAG